MASKTKQRGGTLLGVIIGALLGLGAALAVAVYVTKVPVPFINKTHSGNANTDAVEEKKNRDWDPNAPLAGKIPAHPLPSAAGSPGVVPAPDPAGAGKPAGSSKAASSDPLGDLARAKAAAARIDSPAPSTGADPFSYFIQAGAFRTPEDAEQQRARLSLMGFQSRVTEREQAGRTVYRVRLGPYNKKDEADSVKQTLDGNAIETALVRVQR